MTKKEFREELITLIRRRNYEVSEVCCVKNNGERDGLLLHTKSSFSPVIYVDKYYDRYLIGTSISKVIEQIIEEISVAAEKEKLLQKMPFVLDMLLDYKKIRKDFRVCLINRQNELISKVPHKDYGDFAGIVYWMLGKEDYRIVISYEVIQRMNMGFDAIFRDAYINMMDEFVLRRYGDILYDEIQEKLKDKLQKNIEGFSEKYIKQMCKGTEMTVLSHKSGLFGAAALCYPKEIDRIAEYIREDTVIVPTSIHELLCIPFEKDLSVEAINELLKKVNSTMNPEERLSESVYVLTKEKQLLKTDEYMKKIHRQTIHADLMHQQSEYTAREEWRNN